MTTRRHRLPLGAELAEGGGVSFRLWAPSARSVELIVDGELLPMANGADGVHERHVPTAGPGSRYRYRIDGDLLVPDPASRFQPDDVHGDSEVIDPAAYAWNDGAWRGRAFDEAVFLEVHPGTFTPEGTLRAAADHLEELAGLGITAVQLMPLADFEGRRGWGYDGVLHFAPEAAYGRPDDLKAFIDRAHSLELMVFLDVVYNHFGPSGNYLHAYAKPFFTERHKTPWGDAINFDSAGSDRVRAFYIANALYWLSEFNADGLRFDAVHAIVDDSPVTFLEELAATARATLPADRQVHLVLENDDNAARLLTRGADHRPLLYTAQWNDDFHHAAHVLLTGEDDGYYADHADRPAARLARCLTQGFDYQGQVSGHRGGAVRGEPSAHLPPTAFVNFLQNHDQVGNRAMGERLDALASPEAMDLATAVLLLAPSPPMLFMGQEWAAPEPFLYFCDFEEPLASAVREGRRGEFRAFARFADPQARENIPDPGAEETFRASILDRSVTDRPAHAHRYGLVRDLLRLRREHIVPLLRGGLRGDGHESPVDGGLVARWKANDGWTLVMAANFGGETLTFHARQPSLIWATDPQTGLSLPPLHGFVGLEPEAA